MVTYLVADSEALGDLTDLTIKSERQMRAWLRKCCRDWFANCAEGANKCPYPLLVYPSHSNPSESFSGRRFL